MRRPAWTRPQPYVGEVIPWDVRRLRLVLAGVAVVTIAVGCWGLYTLIATNPTSPPEPQRLFTPAVAASATGAQRRDAIAAAPMLAVPPLSLQDAAPGTSQPDPVTVPAATGIGAAQVPSGYPRTPAGALGQLGSLSAAVVQQMSMPYTQQVHTAWSAPGAGDIDQWPLAVNVRSFLGKTRMGPAKSADAAIVAFPVAGQIKGNDGPDWQLACVLLDIRARNRSGDHRQVIYGVCERMRWQGTRWVMDTGARPAPPPATWPGTALSAQAGWRPWRMTTTHQD